MIRAKHIRMTPVMRGETTVKETELRDLRRKQVAHDGYVRATQRMREALAVVGTGTTEYAQGFRDAIAAFGELVIEEAREGI